MHMNLEERRTTMLRRILTAAIAVVLTVTGLILMEQLLRGIQLFECIKGDSFSIQGLPLLPLMSALREIKILQT